MKRYLTRRKCVGVSVAGGFFSLMVMLWCIAALNISAQAQTVDGLQIQLNGVRDMARDNAADIKLLSAQVGRNSEDISRLTGSVTELVAASNKLYGIGLVIGALGGIIFIFQSVTLVKQRRAA